ncbi:MAG: hypothetical protein GW905_10090 [Rhodobacterales bacterium]|nr:hypothetical protein [Rhodobacterales bacterium]
MNNLLRWFLRRNRAWSENLLKWFPGIFAGPSYVDYLLAEINSGILSTRPAVVLEAGGVDRPMLARSPNYHYVGLDIEFRPECGHVYDEFLVQSIEDPVPVKSDMIVSITLMEHVPNNTKSVAAIFASLNPSGRTYHYIPSGLHPYSIALRLIGPKLQRKLIPLLRPGTEGITGYPAFFDKCTPAAMERLFRQTGFTKISVKPFYRANDYFAFFVPAYVLVSLLENLCNLLRLRLFASGFVISARHP